MMPGKHTMSKVPETVENSGLQTDLEGGIVTPGSVGHYGHGVQDEFQLVPALRQTNPDRGPEGAKTALLGTIFMETDMTDAVSVRDHLMERWEKGFGVRLSLNHMVLKAAAMVMKEHPEFNPMLGGEGHPTWEQVDLGVSVFVDSGVVTPVLRDVGGLSLVEIASQVGRFYERAAERRLAQDELSTGALTVTNLGKYGADTMALQSDPPAAAILGVGRCVKRAVVVDDEIKPRWLMVLSLSFDGRIMDGAKSAQFLGLIKDILERPTVLVL